MWIDREISSELIDISRTFPVLALIGPRQVGKTSILEKVFPEYAYASLDVGVNAEAAETRPEAFLKQYPPPVALDEIQYAPSFFRFIKNYTDAHKGENGLFILTGSQNFMLMDAISDSLAGRAAVVPFLSLSGNEWAAVEKPDGADAWKTFLWKGGFPALWADPDAGPSRDRWYQGYVATYLERDVRNLLNVGNLRDFERFIRACAARCAQTLNISEIGRDVGVSATTARQWLSVLQASNQVFLLAPYYRSLGKRIIKSPKLYFTNTGLAAYLTGFSSADALWTSMNAGAFWENHVINQWIRRRDWHEPSLGLWYWRDQGGNEVDLVLERNGKLIPVECKITERPGAKAARNIEKFSAFYGGEQISKGYVACPAGMEFEITEGVVAVPGWTAWKLG